MSLDINNLTHQRPVHGGALHRAVNEFGGKLGSWIDLSTGISPTSWPVPDVPEQVWQRLPDNDDGLVAQAASYYGCKVSEILPISGSQFAIEKIPQLLATSDVAVPVWGYAEHSFRWQLAGHRLHWYENGHQLAQMVRSEVVNAAVVINPNNPTTETFNKSELLNIAGLLAKRGGQLVVDEAFVDSCSEYSLCTALGGQSCPQGLIILRSVGKFFGLAGIRLGFVISDSSFIHHLESQMSPWAVNHVARWLGLNALADHDWHVTQCKTLSDDSESFLQQLKIVLPDFAWQRSDCFVTAFASRAKCENLYRQLGEAAVLVRLLFSARDALSNNKKDGAAVRFGLPTNSQQLELMDRIKSSVRKPICSD